MIELSVYNGNIKILRPETLTSGRVGHKIHFSFNNKWAGLNKKATFLAGNVSRTIDLTGNFECDAEIPSETLETPDLDLMVAVKGLSDDLSVILPTKYLRLGYIHKGARILKEESAYMREHSDEIELRIATEQEIDEMLNDVFSK